MDRQTLIHAPRRLDTPRLFLETPAKAHAAVRGMTGVAWSYEDPAAAAKVVQDFKKEHAEKAAKLKIKTGMLGGKLIEGETLAKIPGLKETRAEIYGLITAPASHIWFSLVAPGAQIAAILDTWVEKQKAAEGAAEGG